MIRSPRLGLRARNTLRFLIGSVVDVIDRRRDHLPGQVLSGFEMMVAKVEGFQQMVLELLEISGIHAGAAAVA